MWLFGRRKKKTTTGEPDTPSEASGSTYSKTEDAGEQALAHSAAAVTDSGTESVENGRVQSGQQTESVAGEDVQPEPEQQTEIVERDDAQPGPQTETVERDGVQPIPEQQTKSVGSDEAQHNPEQQAETVGEGTAAQEQEKENESVPEDVEKSGSYVPGPSGQGEKTPEEKAELDREKQPDDTASVSSDTKKNSGSGAGISSEPEGSDSAEAFSSISLYDWGRKKKKKKKSEKRRIRKQSVRVGSGEKSVVLGEGHTKICVPITGRTLEEVVDQSANAAMAFPDLVEWRADYFEKLQSLQVNPDSGELPVNSAASVFPELDFALKKITEALNGIPLLFTLRTASEGGEINLYPEDYIRILLHAAERPEVDAVDVEELRTDTDTEVLTREIQKRQKPVIGSAHFFDRMPKKAEQLELLARISRTGADVLKLAAMPSDGKDVLKMMAACEEENRLTEKPVIAIAMGKTGAVSRISGKITGSCLTFGTVDASSAPGQIPVQTLRTILDVLE